MSHVTEDYPLGVPVETLGGETVIAREYKRTGKTQRIPRVGTCETVLYAEVQVIGEVSRAA